jgi:ribonuclease Z
MTTKITRRDALKLSGAAMGGLTLAGPVHGWDRLAPPQGLAQKNTLYQSLRPMRPSEPVGEHEMRISLIGTSVIERRSQVRSSVFVELGSPDPETNECFVFDCGSGVVSNYVAMDIPWSKVSRVFLTHLHGDHTSDLTHIYCFGPQGDRKFPLSIWGPGPSGVRNPTAGDADQDYSPEFFNDGTIEFAMHFREMNRWHTESQSFVSTQFYAALGDGYDIFVTELDWKEGYSKHWSTKKSLSSPSDHDEARDQWVAYWNKEKGVKVSFFPAVHGRNGSLSYRLDWEAEGLSMIFTGDTKPNYYLVKGGALENPKPVDVYISEVVVDPDIWVARQSGMTDPEDEDFARGLVNAEAVQENSHTPQKAFGYILRKLQDAGKAPRLAVGTHFQATDDTISMAMGDIRSWYSGEVTIASDLMVLRVTNRAVEQYRAVVSDYSWSAHWNRTRPMKDPKYHDDRPCNPYAPMAPLAQFDDDLLDQVIDPCLYDKNGWQCTNNENACEDLKP